MSIRHLAVLGTALLAVACGPSRGADGDAGADVIGGTCAAGTQRCDGNQRLLCENDRWVVADTCPNVCVDSLGCVLCEPGTGTCNGDTSTACKDDGSGYEDIFCDPLQGTLCNFETGVCAGECAPANIGKNYIGCEYFPTVTGNEVDNAFTFAVAVSNTSATVANVHVEGGALATPMTFTVAPQTVQVQVLPWVPQLKACTNGGGAIECGAPMESSVLALKGAYHLRSDQPVTVYQFNPLDYQIGGSCSLGGVGCSYTNDASLLLPANAMTGNYFVASYPTWPGPLGNWPGFMTITATRDNTQVTIATTASTQAGTGIPAFATGVAQTLTMNQGDAAQLFTITGDLTGSVVQADKPVQVIGGHYCTQAPNGITACDHIEESIFPFEALDNKYIVSAPAVPVLPNGKVRIVRIVATEPNTTLTYDPPQAALPTTIANTGNFIEAIGMRETFFISANHKVLVYEVMEGQEAEGNTGDPAMSLAVPVGQYRAAYQFHAPQNGAP